MSKKVMLKEKGKCSDGNDYTYPIGNKACKQSTDIEDETQSGHVSYVSDKIFLVKGGKSHLHSSEEILEACHDKVVFGG